LSDFWLRTGDVRLLNFVVERTLVSQKSVAAAALNNRGCLSSQVQSPASASPPALKAFMDQQPAVRLRFFSCLPATKRQTFLFFSVIA